MLTEEAVLLAWHRLIRQAVDGPSWNLEREDREQVAWMGLLYAIRTWRRGMRAFEPYANDCISAYLRHEEAQQRRARRAESRLSLDATIVRCETEATYGDFLLVAEEPAYAALLERL